MVWMENLELVLYAKQEIQGSHIPQQHMAPRQSSYNYSKTRISRSVTLLLALRLPLV